MQSGNTHLVIILFELMIYNLDMHHYKKKVKINT
jgi:hypothetical protein